MNKINAGISRLMLERYLCGETTTREKMAIETAYEHDPEVREALDGLRASTAEILSEYPAAEVAREIELRTHLRNTEKTMPAAKRFTSINIRWIAAPLGTCAVLAVVVCLSLAVWRGNRQSVIVERVKGRHPYLTVYRKTQNGFERLHDRSVVEPNDRIQIGYVAAGKKYGMIFSVDGNGVITVHYPAGETVNDSATKLETNGEHLLPESFELDAAPRFEKVYFITSDDSPIAVRKLLAGWKQRIGGAPIDTASPIPYKRGRYQQASITLLKGGQK